MFETTLQYCLKFKPVFLLVDKSQKAYPRTVIKQGNSLLVNIPSHIVHKLGIQAGQFILVGENDGLVIIKPMDIKLAKKDLKTDSFDMNQSKNPNSKKKYDNPLDDPDFNPLDRLEIK